MLYNTVISSHETTITHTAPPQAPTARIVSAQAAAAFSGNQAQQIPSPGAYSVPVRIEGGQSNDPTLSGYETPSFIHKKEINLTDNGQNYQVFSTPVQTIQASIQQDTQVFSDQLNVCKTKSEKAKVCKDMAI
jgi:hypothetical protein